MKTAFTVFWAALLASLAFSQNAVAPATFELASVRVSPPGGFLRARKGPTTVGSRFQVLNGTMIDLISAAYGVDADRIVDGPNWLELGPLRCSGSDGPGEGGCKTSMQNAGRGGAPADTGLVSVRTCHKMTMEDFAQSLRKGITSPYLSPNVPVIDSTGLKGGWDFVFNVPLRIGSANGLPGMLEDQLGLGLEPRKVPVQVLVVDSADRKPADDAPGIAEKLNPGPPAAFEVAEVKPVDPAARTPMMPRLTGSEIMLAGMPMSLLVDVAFSLDPGAGGRIKVYEGIPAGEKDPRIVHPERTRLVTAQNLTMAQFAKRLQGITPGGLIASPVLDASGLTGSSDFTLNFSPASGPRTAAGTAGGGTGSDPGAAAIARAAEAACQGFRNRPLRCKHPRLIEPGDYSRTCHSDLDAARPHAGALTDSSRETLPRGRPHEGEAGKQRGEQVRSEVFGVEPGLLADLREKPRADFLAIMERKRVIGPPGTLEPPVRAFLPGDLPSYPGQGSQQLLRLDRSPAAHATENTLPSGSGISSP